MRARRRYEVRQLRPNGTMRPGTFGRLARYYANDTMARRYFYRHLVNLPTGQYELVEWPESGSGMPERFICHLYRRGQ
jgi:hypothetical protein